MKSGSTLLFVAGVSSWPFLHLASTNFGRLEWADLLHLLGFWAGTILLALILAVVGCTIFRRLTFGRCSSAAGVLVLMIYLFGAISSHAQLTFLVHVRHGIAGAYLAATLIACTLALTLSRSLTGRRVLAVFAATLMLLPGASIALQALKPSAVVSAEKAPHAAIAKFVDRPNVILLVTDAYARADKLLQLTGLDNSAFLAQLEARGFSVAGNSHSNYPVTYLSLASMLDMRYPADEQTRYSSRQPFVATTRGSNRAVETFLTNGYVYVHSGNSWGGSRCGNKQAGMVCLNEGMSFVREIDTLIFDMTPLPNIRDRIFRGDSDLGWLSEQVPRLFQRTPFFLFAHTLPPHPPYERGRRCEYVRAPAALANAWLIDPYRDAVLCVNRQIIEFVDRVTSRDENAVIIIASDHGSGFLFQSQRRLGEWGQAVIDERFANLLALRLPARCRASVPSTLTNVNVLRLVVDCLARRESEPLPNRYYAVAYEDSEDFGKVRRVRPTGTERDTD